MPLDPIRVEGLAELQAAFRASDRVLERSLRGTLREVAEPVRADAERLAVSEIPRMTMPWSRMRVGVTKTMVYVAPVERGRRSRNNPALRRPNLAGLLMGRSMAPALEANHREIIDGLESMLNLAEVAWGRAA